jgi:bis(5'-nucleosyl)-tetraphosphatase (symmetrical)
MRKIIIGDVHGCIDELQQLLEKLHFSPNERLIFTGDLVDRGPDTISVVELAQSLNAKVAIGNHDERFTRWHKREQESHATGKKNPMKPLDAERQTTYKQLVEFNLIDWMATWSPCVSVTPTMVVVHAGLRPSVPLARQKPSDLLHVRFIDNITGNPATLVNLQQPPNSTYWSELWHGPDSVVYGHNAVDAPRVDVPAPGVTCFGIDTGCVFGGKLTALVIHDEQHYEFVQVQARREYSPRVITEE